MQSKKYFLKLVLVATFTALLLVILLDVNAINKKIAANEEEQTKAMEEKVKETLGSVVIFEREVFGGLVKRIEENVTKLLEDVSKKIGRLAEEKILGNEAAANAMKEEVKETLGSVVIFEREVFGGLVKRIEENVTKLLEDVSKKIGRLAEEKILGNEAAANAAFKMALDFTRKNDLVNAKLYCLNAINHAPNKKCYFEELLKIQQGFPDATPDDWGQIQSVLELGIYQVDAKDIASFQTMLQTVVSMRDAATAKLAKESLERTKDALAKELTKVRDGNLSASERLEALNALAEQADLLSASDAKWVDSERGKAISSFKFNFASNVIANCLGQAEVALEKNDASPAVNSMVQHANYLFAQMWELDRNTLPQDAAEKLNQYAERIADIEKKFNLVKSQPALANIEKLKSQISKNGSLTVQIKVIQDTAQEIHAELPKVYDLDKRNEVEKYIYKLMQSARELERERYKAYQTWAVEKCKGGFEYWSGEMVFDDDDADLVLRKFFLEIDPALLTQPIHSLYQTLLETKLLNELDEKESVKWRIQLAISKKKGLEDF